MVYKKIITNEPDSFSVYIKKIWSFRSLIFTFAKRDLKIKYAQTFLGLAWSVIQPMVAIIVYTLFFNFLVDVPTGETNYILFVLSGVTLWTFFSYIFGQGSYSLVNNQEIIRKMAFPKIILPLAKVMVGLTEFGVSFLLLSIAWLFWGNGFDWRLFFMPLPILGVLLFAFSITIFLLSASIKRRDLLHIAPFFVNFGIWFTPVFYPVSLIPDKYQEWIYLNPLAGMIVFFRWTIGIETDFSQFFLIGLCLILFLFVLSVYLFKNMEDKIVDNI